MDIVFRFYLCSDMTMRDLAFVLVHCTEWPYLILVFCKIVDVQHHGQLATDLFFFTSSFFSLKYLQIIPRLEVGVRPVIAATWRH